MLLIKSATLFRLFNDRVFFSPLFYIQNLIFFCSIFRHEVNLPSLIATLSELSNFLCFYLSSTGLCSERLPTFSVSRLSTGLPEHSPQDRAQAQEVGPGVYPWGGKLGALSCFSLNPRGEAGAARGDTLVPRDAQCRWWAYRRRCIVSPTCTVPAWVISTIRHL